MPTPAEHRALLFVAAVAALGIAVRGVQQFHEPEVPVADRAALARQIANVDSVLATGGRRRTTTPKAAAPPRAPSTRARPEALRPVESPGPIAAALVDMDLADSAALVALPGIGPTLAARIVADRAAQGPFGSLEALQRVKGIGPALARRVQPYVTFSLPPRPTDAEHSARQGVRRP